MSTPWDDFHKPPDVRPSKESGVEARKQEETEVRTGCDWGFSRQEGQTGEGELAGIDLDSSKFVPIYERYLEDKHSIDNETNNFNTYKNNPQKALRTWFDNEGHEFEVKTKLAKEDQYICSIDLPIGEHDFTLTSDIQNRKQSAVDQVCLTACKLLDQSDLLYSWQSNSEVDPEKKRRLDEVNKEDDIELDNTDSGKRRCSSFETTSESKNATQCSSRAISKVSTYESLMARWKELNLAILMLKAKLVRMDLRVSKQNSADQKFQETKTDGLKGSGEDEEEEVDPLDEYMSSLETKTKLSMDEKIEKSRIKSQLAAHEREQSEVSRLIELAKPKFDFNKACPSKT